MVTQESINYIAEGLAGRRKVEFLQIVQQRAELLEALKKFVDESEEHDVGGADVVFATCESREAAIEAITKAEAAE